MEPSKPLNRFPKIDLHLHLDGSVKPETVIELAAEQGKALPAGDPEALAPYMRAGMDCSSLDEYLEKFRFVGKFLHTREALERIAFEVVEQAAEQDCIYIEVRFAPQLHRDEGLTVDEVIRSVLDGLKRGEEAFGVKARGIAICMRHHDQELNMDVVDAAAAFLGKGLVAVDLAGAEAAYPAKRFKEVFARARRLGLPVTIHAGEAAGPENIEDAVTLLGASRIGHGVRLKESGEAMKLVMDRGIPLEMCPISNIQTKAVTDWSVYPIREYFDLGLRVTVNTDNLTVSDTNLSKEYAVLRERFGFTDRELARLVMNAAEAAFLPEEEKRALRSGLEQAFKRLLQ